MTSSVVPRYTFGIPRDTARGIAVYAVYRETAERNTAVLNSGVVSFALSWEELSRSVLKTELWVPSKVEDTYKWITYQSLNDHNVISLKGLGHYTMLLMIRRCRCNTCKKAITDWMQAIMEPPHLQTTYWDQNQAYQQTTILRCTCHKTMSRENK